MEDHTDPTEMDEVKKSEVEEEEEEGGLEQALTEDAFSMLYTANYCSRTFLFSGIVFILQAGMLIVTFINIVDLGPDGTQTVTNSVSNRMGIPAGVSTTVTLGQFIGFAMVIMLVVVESDLVSGLTQLIEGHDPVIQHVMPQASYWRWLTTGSVQLLFGAVLVMDSIILTLQNTDVIQLILDLTALFFIQEVDDIAFKLAHVGILSRPIQEHCEKVTQLKRVFPRETVNRRIFGRRALTIILIIALYVPFGIVLGWQMDGRYLCKHVFIQFGDAYENDMAYYSGQFHQQGFSWAAREANRVVYVDETDTLKLAYCNVETAWTISLKAASSPCEYMFISENTESFDIVEVAGGSWFVKTGIGNVPVDWLKLICNDCNDEICNPEYGTCVRDDSKGSTLNKCVCHKVPDWSTLMKSRPVGLNCDLVAQCQFLAPDARTTEELPTIPGASALIGTQFRDLGRDREDEDENATMMHHQPIYVEFVDNSTTYLTAFMMFTGRRWVIFKAPQGSNQAIDLEEFVGFLKGNDAANNPVQTLKNISKAYSNFQPLVFTVPVNYGGQSYHREAGVTWVLTEKAENDTILSRRPDDSQELPVRYLCSDCWSRPDICQNGGVCNDEDGYCECPFYYTGYQCERAILCNEVWLHDEGWCHQGGECAANGVCVNCDPGVRGNLCELGVPDEVRDVFFCSHCDLQFGSYNCDFPNQICYCLDGWSGEFCEIEGYATNSTNSTEDYTELLGDGTTSGILGNASDPELLGNGTTIVIFGNASDPAENETGLVRP